MYETPFLFEEEFFYKKTVSKSENGRVP